MTLSPGFEVIMVPNCLSQERLMKVLQTIIGGEELKYFRFYQTLLD
jgi:hypothetical protein